MTDRAAWDPHEPLPLPRDIADDFDALTESIVCAARGEIERARAVLRTTQGSARARDWYIEHAQQSGYCRWRVLTPGAKKPSGDRDALVYPRPAVEAEVFRTGAHRCAYCQRPIVAGRILKAFKALIADEQLFGMGKSNATTHGLVFLHRGVADHLDPRSHGGPTDLSNLVPACYACNFGKAQFTLAEMGLVGVRPPKKDNWNGLEHLSETLSRLARAARKLPRKAVDNGTIDRRLIRYHDVRRF